MNLVVAQEIVRSANPDVVDVVLNDLLERSKFQLSGDYRPYLVAAFTLIVNPPRGDLIRADGEATWSDWERRVRMLLTTQESVDCIYARTEGEEIPCGWNVTEVRSRFCDTCQTDISSGLGIAAFGVVSFNRHC